MKKKILLLLTTLGAVFALYSCKKSDVDANDSSFQLVHHITTVDGVKTNTVKQGDNFVFHLTISNNSDEEWYVNHQSIIASNITELYKKSTSGGDSLAGQAFTSAECSFQSGVSIPPRGTYQVSIPWIADKSVTRVPSCSLLTKNNIPLPAGHYKTNMQGNIQLFRSGLTRQISLTKHDVSFEIQ